MSKSIFVTGTGTDIGKTYVSALIMKKMVSENMNACYFKPVLSGAEKRDGKIYAGDIEYVKEISGLNEDTENMGSFIYEYPASPHLSAKLENKPFNMEKVVQDYKKLSEKYEYILIEGAGGIFCPFTDDFEPIYTKDIIKALNTSCIIVANTALGAINNVMLSIYYMRDKQIDIKGIIFNGYKDSLIEQENIKFIIKHSRLKLLAVVNHKDNYINVDFKNIFGE